MKNANQSIAEQAFRAALALYGKGELEAARAVLLKHADLSEVLPERLQLLGIVCGDLGRGAEAIEHLQRAVRVSPNSASAHFNLGRICLMFQRRKEAAHSLQQATRLTPKNVEAIYLLGTALLLLDLHEQAIEAFTGALELDPAHGPALAGLIEGKQRLAVWTDYQSNKKRLMQDLEQKKPSAGPFALLRIFDDPELHLTIARREAASNRRNGAVRFPTPSLQAKRLRLAYISADFCRHPTSRLMASFFAHHDREKFEVIGVSLCADDGSAIRKRLVVGFDHLVEAEEKSAQSINEKLRAMDVAIAIDLMGHTQNSRPAIFQKRAAPIQVSYLGYPGTTGAGWMDYIILDPFIATERVRRNLSEKPVILPDCYQINDRERACPETALTRSEYRLPDDGFIFCAFNNIFKITPDIFDIWTRILRSVDGSVLWLLSGKPTVDANLRQEAAARGVSPDRLVFGKRLEAEEHLSRYRVADLSLDTFPYGGHTTTSDALWMGCPVLTCAGASIAARVAGSLLHTVGLPELATNSLQDYEALAIALAREPERLAQMRATLAARRLTTPLFDTALFARNIEKAYLEMWRLYQKGEGPREIDLSDPASFAVRGSSG
jgi:predicted O-linked N-acetylglucosamine transferase (SPINDLY family)